MAGRAFGCGQCMPCRFNKRREWTHRIMLEASQHENNCFVTLTYSDDEMPHNGSLRPKDLQDFLKRFRKAIEPSRIRFFACGEYGDLTWRPHYHLALFGYKNCRFGRSSYSAITRNCCEHCDLVRDSWGKGLVQVGSLTTDSAQYVAGYVTKKLSKADDPRLERMGQVLEPEFARQSRRPGIGVTALPEIASTLMEFNLDTSQSDVPVTLRHGSRQFPLGRTLRRKLRAQIGKEENAPYIETQSTEELRALYEDAKKTIQARTFVPGALDHDFKEKILKRYEGKRTNFYARSRIFKKRGTI